MAKKRTRYSSSISAEWVLPAEEPSPYKIDEAVAPPTKPHLSQSKKTSRYKANFPSSWVDTQFNSDMVERIQTQQAVRVQAQQSEDPIDYELLRLGSEGRRMSRSHWLASNVDLPVRNMEDNKYNHPQAAAGEPPHVPSQKPLSADVGSQNFLSYLADLRMAGQSHQRRSELEYGSTSTDQSVISQDQPVAQLSMHRHDTHGSTISPPVSVGQDSSQSTASPYHGRDLPAKGPAISPTYSVI